MKNRRQLFGLLLVGVFTITACNGPQTVPTPAPDPKPAPDPTPAPDPKPAPIPAPEISPLVSTTDGAGYQKYEGGEKIAITAGSNINGQILDGLTDGKMSYGEGARFVTIKANSSEYLDLGFTKAMIGAFQIATLEVYESHTIKFVKIETSSDNGKIWELIGYAKFDGGASYNMVKFKEPKKINKIRLSDFHTYSINDQVVDLYEIEVYKNEN